MNRFLRWGANFGIDMFCEGNKGVLSIPIYSYIDKTHNIKITNVKVEEDNIIKIDFIYKSSKPETKYIDKLVNGSTESPRTRNQRETTGKSSKEKRPEA